MIKLLVSQSDLLKGLNIVATALPPRTSLPSLTNILLRAEKNELHLAATDLDTTITTTVSTTITTPGTIALPGKKFHEIIRELPHEDVHIGGTGNRINIKCCSSSFSLGGSSSDSFPTLPMLEDTNAAIIPTERLTSAIRRTSFAVATDDYRPALNGALWKLDPNGFEMVATDGHRLAKIHLSDVKSENELEAIVAPKALNLIAKLASEGQIHIRFQGTQISFQFDKTIIFTRIIDGPYPPYEKVIPVDNDKILKMNREDLISAIRRMIIIADPSTHQVKFSLETDNISIQTENTDTGEAKEILEASYEGSPMIIGFNGSFFLEILKNLSTEEITVSMKTNTAAVIVESPEAEAFTKYVALLMPVKLPGVEV